MTLNLCYNCKLVYIFITEPLMVYKDLWVLICVYQMHPIKSVLTEDCISLSQPDALEMHRLHIKEFPAQHLYPWEHWYLRRITYGSYPAWERLTYNQKARFYYGLKKNMIAFHWVEKLIMFCQPLYFQNSLCHQN